MLDHVPSFGRNPRGSPDFLAYPVPKACMHVLGTGVARCLGVARSASRPKAAQALGCSLTPGLRISFGRVTCMARAASMPGLWTLGFLLLRGACVWVLVVVGFRFRLRPATLAWGVGVCVRLCVCSACTQPDLARVRVVGAVFGLGFRLCPATPGWGVGLCACSACTQQLLARVRGVGVCVWARVSAAHSHSWHGCAVWVCVFGLGFWLRPATPGWGVGLCVCSACTQPLLAQVRGVGVCVWARVSAAPRHSWLGCWAVCVLVCALRLHPATPGTGARCGCVCLGSGFCCAPPLLAGVLGCVRAPLARSHSWHGCAVWVCVFGLGFRLRPAPPVWGVGLCVCSACTQPILARVRRVGVCVWAQVSAAPRHSRLGCWTACVLRLHPATPGTGARCGCVSLGSGSGCAPPLLAGVLGRLHAPLAPSHSWHGCAVWVCVFGLGFPLRPTTPGWGVGLCACSACTQPLLARVRGVGVCIWARASAAPRLSWLGCWAVCVLRSHPATPGTGERCGCVCLGSGFGCAPPLLAGVLGCVRAGGAGPRTGSSGGERGPRTGASGAAERIRKKKKRRRKGEARARRGGEGGQGGHEPGGRGEVTHTPTHPLDHSPTHPLTHSPTHRLTHSPTHPLTHSPTQPLTHSPTHPLTHSPTHPLTHSPTHPLTHSPTHPLTHSPTHQLGHSPTHPLTHSPTRPLTHSPAHPLTHTPTHALTHPPTHTLTHSPTHPLTHSTTHPLTHSPTHPLTHSPTHPLTHSPTHPLTHSTSRPITHSPTHPLTHSPTHPLTHSPTHQLTHSPTHPLTHSPAHPLTHSPTQPLTHSPTHPLTHSPTHPLTHSPTHPLTHSPTHPLTHSPTHPLTHSPTPAPHHSWLGCRAVCVLCLHPATPGTGARCGCVYSGSGFGCTPPLLAWVLGCVCAPLVPSHSWHG